MAKERISTWLRLKRALLYRLAPYIKNDKAFLKMKWKLYMDYPLNLDNPQTFNEKIQWQKLHDRKPEYTKMVDKYEAKEYVAGIIGREHIIPTIAVYDRVEDIDFDALPNQFVLKCTHDSGGIVVCKDKAKLDIEAAKKKLGKGLKTDFYYQTREWPYKAVKPRIIAEQYLVDESGYELKDYKWLCFDGEPKVLLIMSDRGLETEETKLDYFDMDFNHFPVCTKGYANSSKKLSRPVGFDKMKELAAKLSKGMMQVRIDFYDIKGKVYFGEITFFQGSGRMPFEPQEWDYKFGSYMTLPK